MLVMRSPHGTRVHVVQENLYGPPPAWIGNSLCDEGPKTTEGYEIWDADVAEITCPKCRKKLKHLQRILAT